ncbi:Enamine deaminase RidA, house cleaning of reactive enamine intermediates, YjgF/YER057c/UK114 family [Colwellia chukchiensis]|uniref:Enamine deaminase RidA, house cleaning of reactive enamine intermediates, YjgF/YER057c/UK114 family n=1 Tax=Colwellia chukchiensis TaxID=641665 RepID=A0A1H7PCD4_9GAMM|nr:RidA family protein [Colwellia chukchiensis]SEL33441.1 Enamine deaminase RidA, house cleaning of reactive enamine intermediates, YjgF/YER057c/UK114 family [Colwellia chukchiensis]
MINRNNPSKYYSQSVVHNDTVYLSGMIAENYQGDMTSQCQETFAAIDAALANAGTDKSKLLSLQCWISDFSYFDDFNDAYEQWLDADSLPVRATAECALYDPRLKIEIIAIAAL